MSYKKAYIETHVEVYIDEMAKVMKKNLTRIIESNALDVENFDPKDLRMGLPKAITHALVNDYLRVIEPTPKQSAQHQATIRNISKFI